jgi:hypothetical protein
MSIDADRVMTFDVNFTSENIGGGFRIFAVEESLNEIPARRYRIPGEVPSIITYFLHPTIFHAGEFKPRIELNIMRVSNIAQEGMTLSLTFD